MVLGFLTPKILKMRKIEIKHELELLSKDLDKIIYGLDSALDENEN